MASCLNSLRRLQQTGAALLVAGCSLPVSADVFTPITTNRTVANGSALASDYMGQVVLIGVTDASRLVKVPDLQVDVVNPAQFGGRFPNATSPGGNGAVEVWSNTRFQVQGGTFGPISLGGPSFLGVKLYDTSQTIFSGGSVTHVSLSGAGPGAAGARATVTGGGIGNSLFPAFSVYNGSLTVSGGTVSASSGNQAIWAGADSDILVNGGTVVSARGPAIYVQAASRLRVTGGSVSSESNLSTSWGVSLQGATTPAELTGGTISGGVIADTAPDAPALQATFGGNVVVNGGVFAKNQAAFNVTGGSYTRFGGADASFFALGANNINFFGSDLVLSAPTAGSMFEKGNGFQSFDGNYYTFLSGTFSDGQSAVGLRIFDALTLAGNAAGLGGGFTISAVPEPSGLVMMLCALPGLAVLVRRRAKATASA